MLPVLPSANTHHIAHLDNNNSASQRPSSIKRNSSMIFRIEHLLPTASAPEVNLMQATSPQAGSRATDSSSVQLPAKRAKLQRSGVFVSQFTPKDTVSESVATLALMSAHNNALTAMEQQQTPTRAYCKLTQDVLCITPAIVRKIKLSEDIHSYNAVFELHQGNVRVRLVRDIGREEEIVAWFGEEVTLLMSIPFLTPLNIQGNNRYTCHLCHLTFETPNPLKIHLALGCGRHSMDILWIRLHYAIQTYSGHHLPPVSACNSTAIISSPQQHQQQHQQRCSPFQPTSSTSSISPAASPQPPPPPTRFSAFKPIFTSTPCIISSSAQPSSYGLQTQHTTITTSTTTMPTSSTLSFLPSISASSLLPPMSLLQPSSTNPLNAAAQIEAIVSNMGASKQGHLCIYCGKVYSRKYGLKIHIRTHTGFKPLKCKFCLRPFGDPSNLNKHVRLHLQTSSSSSPGEGYKCHLCHKTLARRRDLQRHIESRHGGQLLKNESE